MAVQTKNVIAQSLKQMVKTKPLSKITVTDLAEDCGISRMTFYYYFEDIYDLVRWICLEEGREAIGACTGYDNWTDGFLSLCRAVLENREFVESVYRSVQHDQIEEYLYRVTRHLVSGVVREQTDREDVPEVEKEKITDFFAIAFVGITLKWVREGFRESPEELTRWLSIIINGQIELAVHNYKSGAFGG